MVGVIASQMLQFDYFSCIANANFQESDSLHLLWLTFSVDMKFIELNQLLGLLRGNMVLLCRARHFFSSESILHSSLLRILV